MADLYFKGKLWLSGNYQIGYEEIRAATIQLLHDTIHIAIFMSRCDTYRDTFSGMRKAF